VLFFFLFAHKLHQYLKFSGIIVDIEIHHNENETFFTSYLNVKSFVDAFLLADQSMLTTQNASPTIDSIVRVLPQPQLSNSIVTPRLQNSGATNLEHEKLLSQKNSDIDQFSTSTYDSDDTSYAKTSVKETRSPTNVFQQTQPFTTEVTKGMFNSASVKNI
jgi:hypothetical protein